MKPSDLVDLRQRLLAFHGSDAARELCLALRRAHPQWNTHWLELAGGDATRAASLEADQYAQALRLADLFHVSGDMSRLAVTAAQTLPEFTYELDLLPSFAGLIWFDEPVGRNLPGAGPGAEFDIVAGLWLAFTGEQPDGKTQEYIWCAWFALLPDGDLSHDYENLVRIGDNEPPGGPFAVLFSALLLMAQRVATESAARPERHASKRARRAGLPVDAIRIIELRRPASGAGHGETAREWAHRWMVRGHWKQQAYGPERSLRKPMWIAPFVKGPADKPLLVGDKVYAWRR